MFTAETYDKASAEIRSIYDQKAREILYEGLEAGFVNHDKMIKILARALYKTDILALDGRIN